MDESLKCGQQLLFRIGSLGDNKKTIEWLLAKALILTENFFHQALEAIAIMGLANLSGNAETDTCVGSFEAGRFIETNQRVNKASGALFTKVFEIFFVSKF
jgi:hypothetical protein